MWKWEPEVRHEYPHSILERKGERSSTFARVNEVSIFAYTNTRPVPCTPATHTPNSPPSFWSLSSSPLRNHARSQPSLCSVPGSSLRSFMHTICVRTTLLFKSFSSRVCTVGPGRVPPGRVQTQRCAVPHRWNNHVVHFAFHMEDNLCRLLSHSHSDKLGMCMPIASHSIGAIG